MHDTSAVRGKVALVIGAANGVGRAGARVLAAQGASVVAADIDLDGARDTVALINDIGGTATGCFVDVTDEASVAAAIATTVATYGSLELLHYAAAEMLSVQRDTDLVSMDADVWDRTMTVNLRGAMLSCKHALPHLIARGGAIVFASTPSGPADLLRVAHAVSKAGVESLAEQITTLHGAQDVRCHAVAPDPGTSSADAQRVAERVAHLLGGGS
ncbi:MAG: short-chain dehydrogenase/reductase [Ilumatobacteraceae bacterium]|nr:short-chain dehydrogenase/reductase [Ilumatobacteraceae bacterium]